MDEDSVKESLLKERATPTIISKNLAELKANKISQKKNGSLVLGADSIINLNEKIVSKPLNRDEALIILQKLNGQKHELKKITLGNFGLLTIFTILFSYLGSFFGTWIRKIKR